MSDLAARREALTTQIRELEREQGAAVLDGRTFDARPLVDAHDELKALDSAETEAARRDRIAAAQSLDADRAHARKEIAEERDRYVAALKRVEDHAKAITADLRVVQSAAENLASLCRRLGSPGTAFVVDPKLTADTISRLFAAELTQVGARCSYGNLKWPSVPLNPDWSAHGRKVAEALQPLIEGN
jgi:hypothetical protein